MDQLPVPPLHQTLQRFLDCVEPLLDDEQLADTRQQVAHFEAGDGPQCQRALLSHAQHQNARGESWLSHEWRDAYLAGRGSLPLTSNVCFQINWPGSLRGVELAADLISRMAVIHRRYLAGEMGVEYSPRGQPLCADQRRYLAGGMRFPMPGSDVFLAGRREVARRDVVVFWRGRAAALRVTDDDGEVASPATLRSGLAEVMRWPAASTPFTALSHLPRETAAQLMSELGNDPTTLASTEQLGDALFAITLMEDDDSQPSDAERLLAGLCAVERSWADKPVTFQVGLASGAVDMHVEHSMVDGAKLKSVVALAQQATPGTGTGTIAPRELTWRGGTEWDARLAEALRQHHPEVLRGRVVRTPAPDPQQSSVRLSHDACQQLIMLYAQLTTWGTVRSTYESVDMRAFRAGRTEVLRPNTTAAVELARALIDATASPAQLVAAQDAHRDWVRACKSGQAIDRHLLDFPSAPSGWGCSRRYSTPQDIERCSTPGCRPPRSATRNRSCATSSPPRCQAGSASITWPPRMATSSA